MQFIYRNRYLVRIDGDVYVYKNDKCKFDQTFLFSSKNFFIGKSKTCLLTDFSGAGGKIDFDGNTLSLKCEDDE